MLLTVDVGNSVTHYGLFDGPKMVKHLCAKTGYVQGQTTNMSRNWTYSDAVVCSVVPGAVPKLKVKPLVVNYKTDLGLKIKYKNPKRVGADRLADAVAAKFIYGYPSLIVDFGTAVTIDAVSEKGDYLGGVIMPGIEMIRRGLYERTALLPLVPLNKPKKILGMTTENAIQSGMYYGLRGMVLNLLDELKKELRFSEKTVIIATGGYAGFMMNGVKNVKIDEFLTLKGLRIIYERNSGK